MKTIAQFAKLTKLYAISNILSHHTQIILKN